MPTFGPLFLSSRAPESFILHTADILIDQLRISAELRTFESLKSVTFILVKNGECNGALSTVLTAEDGLPGFQILMLAITKRRSKINVYQCHMDIIRSPKAQQRLMTF